MPIPNPAASCELRVGIPAPQMSQDEQSLTAGRRPPPARPDLPLPGQELRHSVHPGPANTRTTQSGWKGLSVLHDRDDNEAIEILNQSRESLSCGGRVFICVLIHTSVSSRQVVSRSEVLVIGAVVRLGRAVRVRDRRSPPSCQRILNEPPSEARASRRKRVGLRARPCCACAVLPRGSGSRMPTPSAWSRTSWPLP